MVVVDFYSLTSAKSSIDIDYQQALNIVQIYMPFAGQRANVDN